MNIFVLLMDSARKSVFKIISKRKKINEIYDQEYEKEQLKQVKKHAKKNAKEKFKNGI